MSGARPNLALQGYEIGISGAVPERQHWPEPAMDHAIMEFIAVFCALVFKYGGRIVHGSHPTFMPVILRQARLHARDRDRAPVTLVMSELWASSLSADEERSLTDTAELIITRRIGPAEPYSKRTRNRSLSAMRRVLVSRQNIMVAVGGKMHDASGHTPGIAEEMRLAANNRVPRFLIGGLGGYSQQMANELLPADLGNHLSAEANMELLGTSDVAACVGVLFGHLTSSAEHIRTLRHPAASADETSHLVVRVANDWRESARPSL